MVLQKNTILITGGSSGIGLALAKKLIEKNNKVLICSRSNEKLEKAKTNNPAVEIFQCDISKEKECERLTDWIKEKHPECNILINNAAVVRIADFNKDEKIIEKANAEIQTNLLAPIILSKFLIPIIENNPNPKLINITSGLAYVPKTTYPFYNATKAALHSFTQVLRVQMQKSAIDIIEVFFPVVDTPFHKGNPPRGAISAIKAVDEMITGIEKGKMEIRVGIIKMLYVMLRIAPKFIFKKLNS
ncbi:MAG: SDR family NAD(P)-dependent oxidoreductase [Ignavibacteriaceae bacterium]|jgi:uncharacterized oxidoreductase